MALKNDDEFDPTLDEDKAPEQEITAQDLSKRMVEVLEALAKSNASLAARADEGPIKQIPLPKAALRTPWNPSGKRLGRPKLTRNTFMNGNLLREVLLSDEDITLLNQIQPGRYFNNKVVVNEKIASEGRDEIEIRAANKTIEDRIAQAQYAPDMTTMLKKMIAEHEALTAK